MAYITEVTYTQTGDTNKAFKITFPFLETSDVNIEVNEVAKTITTHYTINGTIVTFEDGVLSGGSTENKIRLFRQTDLSSTDPTFQTGSSIRAQDLNKLKNRLLYAAQEYGTGPAGTDVDLTTGDKNHITVNTATDWTINNNKISNAMMLDDSIDTAEIKDDAVTSAKILDGNVTLAKIAEAAVDEHRLSISNAGSNGNFLTKSDTTGGLTWAGGAANQNDRDAASGCVTFLRTSASNNGTDPDTFTGYKPDGSVISTSGTTTGGLQEAINYAANNGLDFFCHGGGIANRPDDTGTAGAIKRIINEPGDNFSGSSINTGNYTTAGSGPDIQLPGGNPVSIAGGSGSGLKVSRVKIENNKVSEIITISDRGSGYINNEVITIPADGLYSGSPVISLLTATSDDVGVITTTSTVTIPPAQNRSYTFECVTLNSIPHADPTGSAIQPALRINSGIMLKFEFKGQVVYHGRGNVVEIKPGVNDVTTDRLPYDSLASGANHGVLAASDIRIDYIVHVSFVGSIANDASCVAMFGNINGNYFQFNEINGSSYVAETGVVENISKRGISISNGNTGLTYDGVTGTHVINDNIFRIGTIHNIAQSGIQVGTGTSVPLPSGNKFEVGYLYNWPAHVSANYTKADIGDPAVPTVTVTTSTNHELDTGNSIYVQFDAGEDLKFANNWYTITDTGDTTFTFTMPAGWPNMAEASDLKYNTCSGIDSFGERNEYNFSQTGGGVGFKAQSTSKNEKVIIRKTNDTLDAISHAPAAIENDYFNEDVTILQKLQVGRIYPQSDSKIYSMQTLADKPVLNLLSSSGSFTSHSIKVGCNTAPGTGWAFLQADSDSDGTPDAEFKLRGDGTGLCDGSWTGGGADYAEYFEWLDSNTSTEDRRGYSVVLENGKIRKALDSDSTDNILGIISAKPSAVGDSAPLKWDGKYLKDDFGSYLLDDNNNRKLNENFNPELEYIPREFRKEWDAVGLVGKISLRKGQPTGSRWIKIKDISATIEEWLVR